MTEDGCAVCAFRDLRASCSDQWAITVLSLFRV